MSSKLSDTELRELKRKVLELHVPVLARDLGKPSRYYPQLQGEGVIGKTEREEIDHKVTTQAKVQQLVDFLSEGGRRGKNGRSAFDVLVDVLEREGVHVSVARGLQKALAKAVEENLQIKGTFI